MQKLIRNQMFLCGSLCGGVTAQRHRCKQARSQLPVPSFACMGGGERRICLWVLRELAAGKAYIFDGLRFEMVPLSICMPPVTSEARLVLRTLSSVWTSAWFLPGHQHMSGRTAIPTDVIQPSSLCRALCVARGVSAQVKGEDGTYLAWMVTGAFSCPLCFPAHSLTLLPMMQQQQSRENTTKIMSVLCSNLSGPLASLTVKAKSSQWLVGPTCIMGPPFLLRWHWWFWLRPSLSPSHMGFFYVL